MLINKLVSGFQDLLKANSEKACIFLIAHELENFMKRLNHYHPYFVVFITQKLVDFLLHGHLEELFEMFLE